MKATAYYRITLLVSKDFEGKDLDSIWEKAKSIETKQLIRFSPGVEWCDGHGEEYLGTIAEWHPAK